jgi:hypothetical protein
MARLTIKIREDGNLMAYPFRKDEYGDDAEWVDSETPNGDGTITVEIQMNGYTDTNAAQEQYLNTSDDVINYGVYS